jgi:hypothetical protein
MVPGKGLHIVLNQEGLDFIEACLAEIRLVYTDGDHDESPKVVLEALLESDMAEWTEVKDNFGHKVFRGMEYKEGELRVTVVLTKQNELRLDIRTWLESYS